jgi:hypothetical protein
MRKKFFLFFFSMFAPALYLLTVSAQGTGFSASQPNLIREENQKPGTTDWIITKVIRDENEPYTAGWHRRKGIEGFTSHTTIRAGETMNIYVSTEPADKYKLDIFRMGYYGGKGGRLIKSIGPLTGAAQPTPSDGVKNLVECKWSVATSFKIPDDWVSGVYLGKLSTIKTNAEAYVIFIVRDNRKADLLYQASDLTWLAYNRWPQWRSLYDSPTDPWGADNAVGYDVSFDRPYALYWNGFPAGFEPLTNGSGEFLMTELPLAYWLEKEGYDVTYISNLDTHTDEAALMRGKVFLSVGHDEYWTQQMVDNVTKARDAGLNIAFLSGNSVSGRVVLLPGTDGRPNRVMRRIDRYKDEQKLMGSRSYGVGWADWTCVNPDHWVFEGTGMKKGEGIPGLVGWEFHGPPLANYPSMEILAQGPVLSEDLEERQHGYAATIYTAPKGNYVFNVATCWWIKALSYPPAYVQAPKHFFMDADKRVQRITKNVLDRMLAVKINQ